MPQTVSLSFCNAVELKKKLEGAGYSVGDKVKARTSDESFDGVIIVYDYGWAVQTPCGERYSSLVSVSPADATESCVPRSVTVNLVNIVTSQDLKSALQGAGYRLDEKVTIIAKDDESEVGEVVECGDGWAVHTKRFGGKRISTIKQVSPYSEEPITSPRPQTLFVDANGAKDFQNRLEAVGYKLGDNVLVDLGGLTPEAAVIRQHIDGWAAWSAKIGHRHISVKSVSLNEESAVSSNDNPQQEGKASMSHIVQSVVGTKPVPNPEAGGKPSNEVVVLQEPQVIVQGTQTEINLQEWIVRNVEKITKSGVTLGSIKVDRSVLPS